MNTFTNLQNLLGAYANTILDLYCLFWGAPQGPIFTFAIKKVLEYLKRQFFKGLKLFLMKLFEVLWRVSHCTFLRRRLFDIRDFLTYDAHCFLFWKNGEKTFFSKSNVQNPSKIWQTFINATFLKKPSLLRHLKKKTFISETFWKSGVL